MALYIFIRCHFYGDCSGRNMGCKQNPGSSYVSPQNVCGKTTQKPINIFSFFFFFFLWLGRQASGCSRRATVQRRISVSGTTCRFFQQRDRAAPSARRWTCDPAGDAHRPSHPLSPRPTGRARQPPPVPPCHPSSRLTHRGSVASVTVTCLSVESDSCPSDASNLARGISVCARHAATPISAAEGDGRRPTREVFFFFLFRFFFYSCHWKWKTQWKFYFFFPSSWPEGTQQEQNCSDALGNQCTVHTSPHANLLNKRQELLLHPACSLVGLVSNRIVCFFFFFYQGHYIDWVN